MARLKTPLLIAVVALLQGIALSADPGQQQPATAESAGQPAGKPATDDATFEVAPPELLYLAWGRGKTAVPKQLRLWGREGNFLTDEKMAEVCGQVQQVTYNLNVARDLNPLFLLCNLDPRLTSATVMPTVIDADGNRHGGGFGLSRSRGQGITVSGANPPVTSLAEWPGRISLELAYPVDNEKVILDLDQAPEKAVKVADDVTWYFDATRVRADKRQPVADATAGVLQQPNTPPGTPAYSFYTVRIVMNDGSEQRIAYVTATQPLADGSRDRIDVTAPIKDVSKIARLQFLRRRFRTTVVHDVPLRIYDMPAEETP